MGPALLPTPLSPPCGPCQELWGPGQGAWRLAHCRGQARSTLARHSRRCRIVGLAGYDCAILRPSAYPLPSFRTETGASQAAYSGTAGARGHGRSSAAGYAFRPFRRLTLGGLAWLVFGLPLRVLPFSGPPFRGICRGVFGLSGPPCGSAGDPWEKPFHAADKWRMRQASESGNMRKVALIHFCHKRQWTRVDKSTARRRRFGKAAISPCGRGSRAGAGAGR